MSDLSAFVELQVREAMSPVREVQQMVSALEMIAGVHREGDGLCKCCSREWPCLTIRHVAWTWRAHPDYKTDWHWNVDDLPAPVVTEAPTVEPHAVAAARLWAELQELHQAHKDWRIGGQDFEDFEDKEAVLDAKILHVMFACAEQLWLRPVAKDWMSGANEYLNGARPYDALRDRGPAEVMAALEAEAQGAIG